MDNDDDDDNNNDNSGSNDNDNDVFQLDEYLEFDPLIQYNYQQSPQQQQQQQQLPPSQPAHDFRNLASEALTDFSLANGKFFQLTMHNHPLTTLLSRSK